MTDSSLPAAASAKWPALPLRIAAALRVQLPDLSDQVVSAILEGVPAYRRPLQGDFGETIRSGVDQSLQRFVDVVADPSADIGVTYAAVRRLGAEEHRAGRSLAALQSAYRIGTRISWRRIAAVAKSEGCSVDEVQALAEALFLYLDELASLTFEGYAVAQAEQAGEQARRRRDALRALVASPHDADRLAETAAQAGWPLAGRVAVAVVRDDPAASSVERRLGPDALIATAGTPGQIVIAWPDPDGPGRETGLIGALAQAEIPAAVGPAVDRADASRSFALARRCYALGANGMLGVPPWHVADHLVPIALSAAQIELDELAGTMLAPLDALKETTAMRLSETLLAWLRADGHRPTVAQELHIHPQTVRYRIGQLRDLFGDALDDPEQRFALELSLRRRVLALT